MMISFRIKRVYMVLLAIFLICGLTNGCNKIIPAQITAGQTTSTANTKLTMPERSSIKAATDDPQTPVSTIDAETTTLYQTSTESELKLTILCDNSKSDAQLEANWGFSCLVETHGKVIMFDTGDDSVTLLDNMRKLNLDSAKIDAIMLSHNHRDHVGGLSRFLAANNNVIVYLPKSFSESFKEVVRSFGAQTEEESEAKELFAGVYSTGELGNEIYEQSLIIITSSGLVIITGCAHPGVVNIVRKARDMLPDKPVFLVLGGFHMDGETSSQIGRVVENLWQLGVINVSPCHCSGDETRRFFQEKYGEHYIDSSVGKTIIVK
jgi:7,8-dihydropterin-6-yl-methyl-4-(beta-D-ribofuranosyl)aminobenzene 5'-phosphate synthase